MHKVLLVDDDHSILEGTSLLLSDEHEVVTAQSVVEGIQILQSNTISVVVVDLHFEGQAHDGIDFIDHIFKFNPQIPVIVLSGDENTKRIVEAMRRPLVDFIAKDGNHDELLKLTIKKAIAKSAKYSKSRAVFLRCFFISETKSKNLVSRLKTITV